MRNYDVYRIGGRIQVLLLQMSITLQTGADCHIKEKKSRNIFLHQDSEFVNTRRDTQF